MNKTQAIKGWNCQFKDQLKLSLALLVASQYIYIYIYKESTPK